MVYKKQQITVLSETTGMATVTLKQTQVVLEKGIFVMRDVPFEIKGGNYISIHPDIVKVRSSLK